MDEEDKTVTDSIETTETQESTSGRGVVGTIISLICCLLCIAWFYASTRGLCYLTEGSTALGFLGWFAINWFFCGIPAVYKTIAQ